MAGGFADENDPAYKFTGMKYHFNSYTMRGRRNWVLATYATVGGLWMVKKMFSGGAPKKVECDPKKKK